MWFSHHGPELERLRYLTDRGDAIRGHRGSSVCSQEEDENFFTSMM